MPTNKHAIIRYQALDKCFSNRYRKYYIDDLIKVCNKALEESGMKWNAGLAERKGYSV